MAVVCKTLGGVQRETLRTTWSSKANGHSLPQFGLNSLTVNHSGSKILRSSPAMDPVRK
ncbi:hypothetical protein BU16DRAFT_561332 [Lophium mytilinum]|uniref:Uncharacterized protein n=1 Tax=Lophium mytilinum TaxID=390894 RepID=A0A6A6QVT9_9PEZI|nr:hypothetical protein BU16DRAFT_561332 [Lophium mytilinum]